MLERELTAFEEAEEKEEERREAQHREAMEAWSAAKARLGAFRDVQDASTTRLRYILQALREAARQGHDKEEGVVASLPPAPPPPVDEDVFVTELGEFYNWAAERKESFESDLGAAEAAFSALRLFLGEEALTEPEEIFEPLHKFLVLACQSLAYKRSGFTPFPFEVGYHPTI